MRDGVAGGEAPRESAVAVDGQRGGVTDPHVPGIAGDDEGVCQGSRGFCERVVSGKTRIAERYRGFRNPDDNA